MLCCIWPEAVIVIEVITGCPVHTLNNRVKTYVALVRHIIGVIAGVEVGEPHNMNRIPFGSHGFT